MQYLLLFFILVTLFVPSRFSFLFFLTSMLQVKLKYFIINRGEYWCPLCRQLGNAVLPISPEIGDLSALVKHPSTCDSDLVEEVDRLLHDLTVPVSIT